MKLDEELQRRVDEHAATAAELVGVPAPPRVGLHELRALIAALRERLPAAELELGPVAEQQDALARLSHRFESRFEALDRIGAAIAELREVTSPREMLTRAGPVLCAGSAFERVIVSLIKSGRMVVEATHFSDDPRAARTVMAELQASPPRLEHPLIETELLRRRRATIVLDADVHPRVDRTMARLMAWRSYVAAPLLVGSQVMGVIHADRGAGRPLDVLDRDVLWEFATGLAQAYESSVLRRTLRDERAQMREFLEWLRARSSELTDAPVTLAAADHTPPAPLPPAPPATDQGGVGGRDDRMVFEGLLTRRELDVLRLLAEGATNRQVADALVISSGTVKFHVGSILRKLRAANRAEAVSRYLRLMGMRVP